MRVYLDALRTQKAGNAVSEYEDAFWPEQTEIHLDQRIIRVAVADGATDAIFSGLWARMLVKSYCKHRIEPQLLPKGISHLGRIWRRIVQKRPLPWYVEERIRSGAFAALIGLELTHTTDDSATGTWSALACGDSCFFQLRNEKLISVFPISRSEEFSNKPFLLSSIEASNFDEVKSAAGSWEEGDCFYLMTDALAHWFLSNCERNSVPWQLLRDITLAKKPSFEKWIAELRSEHQIKNDDCTLVSITFEHC